MPFTVEVQHYEKNYGDGEVLTTTHKEVMDMGVVQTIKPNGQPTFEVGIYGPTKKSEASGLCISEQHHYFAATEVNIKLSGEIL